MSKAFQFQESLGETSLPEMFSTIYRHRVSGLVELSRDGVTKRIYINEGNVIHATSTERSDRLGAHLYRTGKLTRKQLVETMRNREQSGRRHGQLLIEEGLLSPGELYESLKSQMEAIVWSVFSWDQGEVTFRIGEWGQPISLKIHLPIRQVIVRGVKMVPDTKALVTRLGRRATVFRPTYTAEDLIEVALSREEYALLRLVDGRRSLYDICSEGPFTVPENARLLYAYRILSLIEGLGTDEKPSSGTVKIFYKTDPSKSFAGDQ